MHSVKRILKMYIFFLILYHLLPLIDESTAHVCIGIAYLSCDVKFDNTIHYISTKLLDLYTINQTRSTFIMQRAKSSFSKIKEQDIDLRCNVKTK